MPSLPSANHRLMYWRLEAASISSTPKSLLEPLRNLASLILHDVNINEIEDEPAMVEADPSIRTEAIEFI